MKARFVFEKFEEDSDPISDMGIGYREFLEIKDGDIIILKKNREDMSFPLEAIVIDHDFVDDDTLKLTFIPFKKISSSTVKSFKRDRKSFIKDFAKMSRSFSIKEWKEYFTVKGSSLFEKFEEDSDPITDLGIGYKKYINLKPGDIVKVKKPIIEEPKERDNILFYPDNSKHNYKINPGNYGLIVSNKYKKGSLTLEIAFFTSKPIEWVIEEVEINPDLFKQNFYINHATADLKTLADHFEILK